MVSYRRKDLLLEESSS